MFVYLLFMSQRDTMSCCSNPEEVYIGTYTSIETAQKYLVKHCAEFSSSHDDFFIMKEEVIK